VPAPCHGANRACAVRLAAESNWPHGAAHAAPPLLKLEQALDEQLLYRAIAKLP